MNNEPDFTKAVDGLLPAIIQDDHTGKVLMQGYMNKESLQRTLDEKVVWFYSRSKQRLWKKGEKSGNEELVRELLINDVKFEKQKEFNWYEKMEDKISLEETTLTYDQKFWEQYNTIKESPLTRQILSDLQKEESLEAQFKN